MTNNVIQFPKNFMAQLVEKIGMPDDGGDQLNMVLEEIRGKLDTFGLGYLLSNDAIYISENKEEMIKQLELMHGAMLETIVFFAFNAEAYARAGIKLKDELDASKCRVKELEELLLNNTKEHCAKPEDVAGKACEEFLRKD